MPDLVVQLGAVEIKGQSGSQAEGRLSGLLANKTELFGKLGLELGDHQGTAKQSKQGSSDGPDEEPVFMEGIEKREDQHSAQWLEIVAVG